MGHAPRKGDHGGALDALYRAQQLYPSDSPNSRAVRTTIRQIRHQQRSAVILSLVPRLDDMLGGTDAPKTAEERLAFAQVCYSMGLHAKAVRFAKEAFGEQSRLAEDDAASDRYTAACSAALAASGKAKDESTPAEASRVLFRNQAREWLSEELAQLTRRLGKNSDDVGNDVRETLANWTKDGDLESVREPAALEALPADERELWRQLWARVQKLIESTRDPQAAAPPRESGRSPEAKAPQP